MSTFLERLDAAAGSATCQMLSSAGQSLVGYGAVSLAAAGTGLVPLSLGAAALVAANYGCTWDPAADGPSGGLFSDWCWDAGDGRMEIYYVTDLGNRAGYLRNDVRRITDIVETGEVNGYGSIQYEVQYINTADSPSTALFYEGRQSNGYYRYYTTGLLDGSTCAYTPGPAGPDPGPYTYTDVDSSCELNVTLEGFAQQGDGAAGPVWKIEPAPAPQLRNGGGIIQGCNFEPVLYYSPPGGGGNGGGPTYIPYDPGPDDPYGNPWWKAALEAALGGVIGAAVKSLLDALLEPSVAGKVYRLTSVCETNAQGEPVDLVREVDIPTLSVLQGSIYRLDAIEYLLQGLKDFKQPTCRKVTYQGQLVSVDFKSDEISPMGKAPLRKLLRYRDQTNAPLADHTAHWESFVWQAGPVIVKHTGATWGELQVWAADADEGKRVIRHAGTIAGVDPDAEGEWAVTGSTDPRYGQPGTMRIATRKSLGGQILQISKRPGPDGLPIVPCDCG